MSPLKLTKTSIANLPCPATEAWHWCPELPGFGVRVQPSGHKSYVLRYRFHGKQRKATIARCEVMPPEDARRVARKMLADLAEGKDPSRQHQGIPTMQAVYDRWLEEHANARNKASTVTRTKSCWELHVKKEVAHLLVTEVKRSHVLAIHGRLHRKPVTANRCVALLSKLFNLANEWEWLTDGSNPARRIRKYTERKRQRILTREELARLHTVLASPDVYPPFARLIRLLLLTGCRVNEVCKARLAWVDIERGLLSLPDSKTGEREVSLSKAAVAEIEGLTGEWLIPAPGGRRALTCPQHMWERVRTLAKLEGVRLHDLRHTVGSYAHHAGMSQREIADLLGHKQMATTARYIHGVGSQQGVNAEKIAQVLGV